MCHILIFSVVTRCIHTHCAGSPSATAIQEHPFCNSFSNWCKVYLLFFYRVTHIILRATDCECVVVASSRNLWKYIVKRQLNHTIPLACSLSACVDTCKKNTHFIGHIIYHYHGECIDIACQEIDASYRMVSKNCILRNGIIIVFLHIPFNIIFHSQQIHSHKRTHVARTHTFFGQRVLSIVYLS